MGVIGAALIADITGSSAFYEGHGTQRGFTEIRSQVERLKADVAAHGGDFIHSRGDDILAFFRDADTAVRAAREMVTSFPGDVFDVHAGIGWGPMLRVPDDLHGSPVNTAARLASLAKPRELLVSGRCYELLNPETRSALHSVDVLQLKGIDDARAVHSYVADEHTERTQLSALLFENQAKPLQMTLRHSGSNHEFSGEAEITIGRSQDNRLVITAPWVSRNHATLRLYSGLVEFRDHSTGGSFVTLSDGAETVVRRSSLTLMGVGEIAFGAPQDQAGPAVVSFHIARH